MAPQTFLWDLTLRLFMGQLFFCHVWPSLTTQHRDVVKLFHQRILPRDEGTLPPLTRKPRLQLRTTVLVEFSGLRFVLIGSFVSFGLPFLLWPRRSHSVSPSLPCLICSNKMATPDRVLGHCPALFEGGVTSRLCPFWLLSFPHFFPLSCSSS